MLRALSFVIQQQVDMVSMCLCMPMAFALACGALGLCMMLDLNICWGLFGITFLLLQSICVCA